MSSGGSDPPPPRLRYNTPAPCFFCSRRSFTTMSSPPSSLSLPKPALGIGLAVFGVLQFVLMDACVKALGQSYPVHQIMFFRFLFAFLPLFALLYFQHGWGHLATRRPGLHLARGALGFAAMFCVFYGFSHLRFADAVAILNSAPLLAMLMAVPLLGERIGIRRALAIGFGLAGALIIARPGSGVFVGAGGVMLLAALLMGCTTNLVRYMAHTEHAVSITFYFTLFGVVIAGLACLGLGWQPVEAGSWPLMVAVGLLGGSAQYHMSQAYRYAEVGLVSPVKYLALVASGVLGFVIWHEVPDTIALFGMALILASGAYALHREAMLARRKAVPVGSDRFS